MKNKRVVALCSAAAVLGMLGSALYVTADEISKGLDLQSDGRSFTVLTGPLKFVSLTPLNRGEGAASLEAMDTVTLAGIEPSSLDKGDDLHIGDTIESGTILSVGALSILMDSNDKEVILQRGEGVVVVGTTLAALACPDCAGSAKKICGDNLVKSVTCGADGACAYSCFPPVAP